MAEPLSTAKKSILSRAEDAAKADVSQTLADFRSAYERLKTVARAFFGRVHADVVTDEAKAQHALNDAAAAHFEAIEQRFSALEAKVTQLIDPTKK